MSETFVRIDGDGYVIDSIVIPSVMDQTVLPETIEREGQEFIATLLGSDPGRAGAWIRTSPSGEFRKRFAGVGYRYIPEADVFVGPQPFPSWILDADYEWQAPAPMPLDDVFYIWDEETVSWIALPEDA